MSKSLHKIFGPYLPWLRDPTDDQSLIDVFDDEQQRKRAEYREEIEILVGPNVEDYENWLLPKDQFKALPRAKRQEIHDRRVNPRYWALLAFLSPVSFFFYRKRWVEGCGFLLLSVFGTVIAKTMGHALFGHLFIGFFAAFLAREVVSDTYHRKIATLRMQEPDRQARLTLLRQQGGVSVKAGQVGAIIHAALFVIAFATRFLVERFPVG
ncbi:MAG: DUF2628 domain-containing protein [Pseudomonadota bacterium]